MTDIIENKIIEDQVNPEEIINPIPQKPVENPPIANILKLLDNVAMQRRRMIPLRKELLMLTDGNIADIETYDKIERIEEQLEQLTIYCRNLENQAVVIMNEHNVCNIPLMETIEKKYIEMEQRENQQDNSHSA